MLHSRMVFNDGKLSGFSDAGLISGQEKPCKVWLDIITEYRYNVGKRLGGA